MDSLLVRFTKAKEWITLDFGSTPERSLIQKEIGRAREERK